MKLLSWVSGLGLVGLAAGFLLSLGSGLEAQPPMPGTMFDSSAAATSTGNQAMLMTTVRGPLGDTQVVMVDTQRKTMAVYALTPDSGIIQLKSVRRLAGDFELEEFNGADPSPAKINGMLRQP